MPSIPDKPHRAQPSALDARSATILDQLPSPVFAVDRNGHLVTFNAACVALTAYPRVEVVGQIYWELLFVPEERDEVRALFATMLADGRPCVHEHHWRTSSGADQLIRVAYTAVLAPDGSVELVIGTGASPLGRDSESVARARAERALRDCEAESRAVLHALPDLVFRLGADGVFRGFFAPDEHHLATPPDQIIGHSLEELLPPDVAEASRRALLQAVESGQVETHEYALDLPDGRQHFEARCVASGPDEVLAIVRNIDRQKQDAEALRKSENSFRALIENSPDLIVVHRHGQIVYANARGIKHLGYDSPDQVVGTSVLEIVHPDDRPLVVERIERMLAIGEPVATIEERLLRRDGSSVFAEVAAIPLEFQGERAVIVVAHDVTARKRAEEERAALETKIQHAQKLESLGVLAGGIAHDFNNLLMGVLGNAGLALMLLPHESPARESLRRIEVAGRRAADLTRQLLAYSGKGRFVVEPIDLSRLVEEMIHLLETVISKRATLRLDLAAGLPLVDADTAQVCQVVMNLITNASDAIGDANGVIAITTGVLNADGGYLATTFLRDQLAEGPYVFLEVSDTGRGMDAATTSRIFDPFFTTKFAGRGLGLAAVMGIVRGHHGAIKVYSEVGRGTTFKVLLPCSASAVASLPPPTPPPAVPSVAKCTVLVVDDDPMVRTSARAVLEHFGFTVVAANDGAEAVRTLRERKDEIDIVLLDMTMPVMGGAEAFREMRGIRADVRVILTSGYNEQDAINRFAGKGLAGFIQKPYSPAELVDKVRGILGR